MNDSCLWRGVAVGIRHTSTYEEKNTQNRLKSLKTTAARLDVAVLFLVVWLTQLAATARAALAWKPTALSDSIVVGLGILKGKGAQIFQQASLAFGGKGNG